MTWAKKEIPSLELCKRLKELGFPQSSGGWYWRVDEYSKWLSFYTDSEYKHRIPDEIFIKAPTCRKMAFWIAEGAKNLAKEDNDKIGYLIAGKELYWEVSPDDFAKDLIWLAENGYVKFKEG